MSERRIDPALTVAQRDHLEHSLGLSYKETPYRSYFCADIGSDDHAVCVALVAMGMMVAGRKINEGQDQYFYVTEAGAAAVGTHLSRG